MECSPPDRVSDIAVLGLLPAHPGLSMAKSIRARKLRSLSGAPVPSSGLRPVDLCSEIFTVSDGIVVSRASVDLFISVNFNVQNVVFRAGKRREIKIAIGLEYVELIPIRPATFSAGSQCSVSAN